MKMKLIQSELVFPCDIDYTLLMWGEIPADAKTVMFLDPYTGEEKKVRVNTANLRVMTNYLERGAVVFAWSNSGYKWAKAAMDALGLDHENIYVLRKPNGHIDDKPAESWMGERVWLSPDDAWGTDGNIRRG